jgi:ribosomal protein S30
MAKYRIKEKFAHKELLITTNPVTKEAINLAGKAKQVTVPATRNRPAYERTIRAATQADFDQIYKAAGNRHGVIELAPEVAKAAEAGPAPKDEVKAGK